MMGIAALMNALENIQCVINFAKNRRILDLLVMRMVPLITGDMLFNVHLVQFVYT